MMDSGQATEKLELYLQQLIADAGFDLHYVLSSRTPSGDGGAVAEDDAKPQLEVHFTGPDVELLTARNAELLHAIETIAADILQLEPAEHHLLLFDAEGFRATRARTLEQAVEDACARVRATGRAHPFPPMNSRERRLIHLAAARLGIQTASLGEGPRRNVVLYPPGQTPGQGNVTLPGERRSRPPFASSNRPGGSRGHARGPEIARSERMPSSDDQSMADGDDTANRISEADRIQAIRERFRKR